MQINWDYADVDLDGDTQGTQRFWNRIVGFCWENVTLDGENKIVYNLYMVV